ncbi:MAG: hypothetical protein WBB67_08965 [bacterium]
MKSEAVQAKLADMESIKKYECPICGSRLRKSMSPSGATGYGKKRQPFTYWNFHCTSEKCSKVWRVPPPLYKTAFGEWPE